MVLKRRKTSVTPATNGCPIANCMALLAGAWTPQIIWALSGGPRRFSELRADLPGISAKMLTARLKTLHDRRLVSRTEMPTSPPTVDYALTDLGQDLIPVIRTMGEVGTRAFLRMNPRRAA
jgi:DNA-binding HxlR family transcriptional regulator